MTDLAHGLSRCDFEAFGEIAGPDISWGERSKFTRQLPERLGGDGENPSFGEDRRLGEVSRWK
jgi:hypothetical protein